METEFQKMQRGQLFYQKDEELTKLRRRARIGLDRLNQASILNERKRELMSRDLFGTADATLMIEPGFYCDYGFNIHFGKHVTVHFNCVFLDAGIIEIGDRTWIGPQVGIYTMLSAQTLEDRQKGLFSQKPVRIGKDCTIGGGSLIYPGVTIGDRVQIEPGTVIRHDILE